MKNKQTEAEKKMARLMSIKKNSEALIKKPMELKKALNYEEWLQKKNETHLTSKKKDEDIKKLAKTTQQLRETVSSASYRKWVRNSSTMPKPVPFGKNLLSLKGSTTKIYVNPEPWKFDE